MARIRTIKPEFWIGAADVWAFGPTLYVLQEGDDGHSKIGLANHPARRLVALQTGNPRPLKIFALYAGERVVCAQIERAILHDFAAHRVRGEWIAAPPEHLVSRIESMMHG